MRTTTSLFLNSLTGSTFLSLATTASASSPHHHSSLFQLSTPTQPFPSPPASPDTATTTSSCDVTASSSTLSSINTIFKCLDLSELNLSALNHLQSVDLSSCSLNLQQCQSIIQHEIAQHPNSLFAQMISKLTNSPDQACPCITSAASNECLPILNHLSSYCELIQSSSSSSTSPIVALSTCSDILHNICPTHSNFQDAFSCLEGHLTELEGKCSIPLNAMMANVYTDCQHDISSLCSSNYVISCLQDNFEVLSSQCQSQFAKYLHGDYPCLDESKLLCPDMIDPDDIFQCLSAYVNSNHKKLSKSCRVIVSGYQACLAEEATPEDGPSDAAPPNSPNGPSDPNPPNGDGSAGGPPHPPDSEPNDQNGVTLPSPKQPPQSRRLQKDKPEPKPKPTPGSDTPCWAKGAPGAQSSGEPDDALHSGASDTMLSHSASQSSSHSSNSMTSIGIIATCIGIIVALLAALIYTQHRNNNSDDMPTVKGYWRAPSIQASLYDDSSHSDGGNGVLYGDGVEMESVSSHSVKVAKIDGLPSSEVRI